MIQLPESAWIGMPPIYSWCYLMIYLPCSNQFWQTNLQAKNQILPRNPDPFPKQKSSNAWQMQWGFFQLGRRPADHWATLTSAVPLEICSVNATKRSIIACLEHNSDPRIHTDFHLLPGSRDYLLTDIYIYIYTYLHGYSLLNGSCFVSLW